MRHILTIILYKQQITSAGTRLGSIHIQHITIQIVYIHTYATNENNITINTNNNELHDKIRRRFTLVLDLSM